MTPVELLVCALATWQAVEVWHHGEIFADWRDAIDGWLDLPHGGAMSYLAWWAGGLLRCPFCQSVWVGWAVTPLVLYGPWYAQVFPYGLAAARLANLGNDLTHARCRTPRNTTPPPADDRPGEDLKTTNGVTQEDDES